MKITTKCIGSSAIVVGLVALLSVGGDRLIRRSEESAHISRARTHKAVNTILQLNILLGDQVEGLKDFILLNRESSQLQKSQAASSQFTATLDELERQTDAAEEFSRVRRRHNYLARLATELSKAPPNNTVKGLSDFQQDFRVINSYERDIKIYLDSLTETLQQQDAKAQQELEQFRQTAQTVRLAIIIVILLVFVAQLVLIFLPVIRSIQKLQQGAAKLGTGDLDYRLDINTKDEIEQLAKEFNQMAQRLAVTYQDLELKKAAADAANLAKSEFLANMSHELRTPLNGILGYAQILQGDRTLSDKQKDGLGIIYQCGSHLLTLINDILDLSKIEARKMEVNPSDFHFPSFLQGVAEICRIRAEQKGISFVYQPTSELPIAIRTDEKRLRQVLLNLLGNAIKFTETGGVTFTVSVLEQSRDAGEMGRSTNYPVTSHHSPRRGGFGNPPVTSPQLPITKIQFQIIDTGVGISPDHIEKIFLPFEQVGGNKKKAEGTGLGLAITQKIVEIMGSTIQVKSELGKGSVFSVDLDLQESLDWVQTARVVSRGKIIGFTGRQRKILVVDDKWENRAVLLNLLEAIGFAIAEATDGKEGLEKTAQFQPDLIITDLAMPVMDGFEMIKHLRNSPDFKDSPIIVSSASVFDTDRHKSIEAGANDFIPKPVQADELLQKLEKHLRLEWIYEATQAEKIPVANSHKANGFSAVPNKEIIGITGSKRKILVVDDKWENRSVIVNILGSIGFEMAEASDGQEGLDKATRFQPDLIITDLSMPVMDGFEMTRCLRRSPEFKDVAIIVSSASVFQSDQHKSLAAGANDFLTKPVQIDDLLQKVQKYLQVEWIYEEKQQAIKEKQPNTGNSLDKNLNDRLIAPPAEELDRLFELAKRGNIKGIREQAENLEKLEEKFVPFAKHLQELAKGFDVKKIREFIKLYRGEL